MATVVLGVAGAALGGLTGIPGGARLGFSIGAVLGGALFPPRQGAQNLGRLADLRITGSQYGAAIPQVWGAHRLPGNVIDYKTDAAGNFLIESSKKRGSKLTGTQRSYSYTASFAVLICAGPISRVKRIWAADRLIYNDDATPKSPYNIRVYLGDETQTPDSLLVAQHGSTATPAYRGSAYTVIQDLPLAQWGNAPPNPLSFEVERWGALTTLVQDSFNRADGALGNADSGQTWLTAGGSALVQSNRGLSGITQCFIDTGISDGTIQTSVWARDVVDGGARIIARYVDTNNYLFWGEGSVTHTYTLQRKQGGLFTLLVNSGITPVDGDTLKLVLNGSTLQGYVNGVLQATTTETFQQTATNHGFGSASATSTVDDFTITPLTSTSIQVKDILADMFGQVGLTSGQWNVAAATDTVDGFLLGDRTTVREAMEPLLRIYKTLACEYDGKIVAVKRGGTAAATIATTDLGAQLWTGSSSPAPRVESKRTQELELPFRIDVQYFSKTRKYEVSHQGAERYTKPHLQEPVTITTPLVLTEDAARQAAEQQLYQIWTEREQFTFSLPPSYLYLTPGDVVNLPVLGQTLRVRLIQVDVELPGPIHCTAVLDDASILTQTVAGAAVITSGEEAADVLTTTLYAWTGPALLDTDSASVGLYVVCGPSTTGYWPGCTIYWSRDGGTTYSELLTVTDASTIGTTATVLAGNPATGTGAFDDADTVDVSVLSGTMASTTSDSDVVNGANVALLGDEVIQFGTVTALGGSSYRLSHLLRARRGTDAHWSEHRSAERFAMLDAGQTFRAVLGEDLRNRSISLKAVTAGQLIGDVTAVSLFVTGDEYRPYAPVSFAGTRAGSDLTLTWIRRARTQADMIDGGDIPLGETVESYSVFALQNSPKTITAVTLGSATVFTSNSHGYAVNDKLLIAGLVGPVYLNGRIVTVTAATTNTFTVVDASAGMPAYVSGGTADKVLRTIAASTPTASYTGAQQTTDFGSAQNPVKLAVVQNGKYGAGFPTVALI